MNKNKMTAASPVSKACAGVAPAGGQHTHKQRLQDYIRVLSNCYRAGNSKPGAITVSPADFDALCDIVNSHAALVAACRLALDSFVGVRPEAYAEASRREFDALTAALALVNGGGK